MIKSKLVKNKLKEAAKKLKRTPEDIWEELAAGYVDNIPSSEEIVDDIECLVKNRGNFKKILFTH